MITDQQIEQEIVAKGKTAPRVTPQLIESRISSEYYFTAEDGVTGEETAKKRPNCVYERSLSLLTFCVLVLENGFTVTGESACASHENFDESIGKRIARDNAIAKIWPLEGYVLRNKLSKSDDMPDIESTQTFTDAEALAQLNS